MSALYFAKHRTGRRARVKRAQHTRHSRRKKKRKKTHKKLFFRENACITFDALFELPHGHTQGLTTQVSTTERQTKIPTSFVEQGSKA